MDPNNPPTTPPTPPATDPRDKKIAELETRIGDISDQLAELAPAMDNIQNSLEVLVKAKGTSATPGEGDDEDKKKITQAVNTSPTEPQDSATVKSMEVKTRGDVVNKIESKYGYDKLSETDRKELRKKVESKLNQFGTSVFTAPVHQLETLLEDAYLLSDIGKAKEQGRLEGLVDARNNELGAMPTMSNTPTDNDSTQLSADQQELANKWGLNKDKVSEHLKELKEKGVITYKPKEERQQQNQPSPSGTPTPPTNPTPNS